MSGFFDCFHKTPGVGLIRLWNSIHADKGPLVDFKTGKGRRYQMGGGWGGSIQWMPGEKLKVVGWKPRIPKVGDFLLAAMESGKTGIFQFKSVDRKNDPPDMFFAQVSFVGYDEEAK